MATVQTLSINDSFSKLLYIIDPYKTNGGTQITAYSIPVSSRTSISVRGEFFCSDVAFGSTAGGNFQATFLRGAGSLARTSGTTASGLISSVLGNFSGTSQPSVDLVANTTSQAIDIKLTGKAGIIIDWHIELTVFRSN